MPKAELYDGTVLEFEDGTPDDVIARVARKQTEELRTAEARRPLPQGVTPSAAGGGRGVVQPPAAPEPEQVAPEAPVPGPASRPWNIGGRGTAPVKAPPAPPTVLDLPTPTYAGGYTSAQIEEGTVAPDRLQAIRQERLAAAKPIPEARALSPAQETAADIRDFTKNPVARGAIAGYLGIGQAGAGAVRLAADLVGAESVADFAGTASRAGRTVGGGMTQDLRGNDKLVADVTASIMQSAPSLVMGAAGGPALSTLFTQTALAEYNEGRNAGFGVGESAARGGIMGMAEAVGERFGFPQQIKLLRGVVRDMPPNELAKTMGELIKREVPGEQLTTALQFLADKAGPAAQNPNATFSDYLEQAGDTLKTTIAQTAVMGGGPAVLAQGRVNDAASARSALTQAERLALDKWGANPYAIANARGFRVEPPLVSDDAKTQRTKTTAIFENTAAQYGIPPGAVSRAKLAAEGLPAAELGPFYSRFVQALQKRNLVGSPVDAHVTDSLEAGPVVLPEERGAETKPSKAEKAVSNIEAIMGGATTPGEPDYSGLSEPEETTTAAGIDEAAHAAATSPQNDLQEPTPAQQDAGNYKLGHHRIGGLDVSIENPQGSIRRSKPDAPVKWETEMQHHYGYIRGTVGQDGDHIDTFIKPGTADDFDGTVFVVDQVDPDTGKPDEHKVLLGFDTEDEARAAYLSNYSKGWRGLGAITATPMADFKTWLKGDTSKPFGGPARAPQQPDVQASAGVVERAPAGGGADAGRGGRVLGPRPDGGVRSSAAAPAPSTGAADAVGTGGGRAGAVAPRVIARVGITPKQALPLELRANADGTSTPWLEGHELLDYDSGAPITVPAGASPEQVLEAVKAARALGPRQKFFPAEPATKPSTEDAKGSPANAAAPAAEATPVEAPAPATGKQTKAAREAEEAMARIATYYAPGNIVRGGMGGFDEVLAFSRGDDGRWSVQVHEVRDVDGTWVRQGKPQDARRHSTAPEERLLKNGPFRKLFPMPGERVPYSEPRADGQPFKNAPARGSVPASAPSALQPQADAPVQKRQQTEADIAAMGGQVVGKNAKGQNVREDANGVRTVAGVQEAVTMRPTAQGIRMERPEHKGDYLTVDEAKPAEAAEPAPLPTKEAAKPEVSKNTIVTDDDAARARAILRSKIGTLRSLLDPEELMAGATLAIYHIERGARTFAAYAKAMVDDIGEGIRPYLKSFYAAVYFDPRAAAMQADMTPLDKLDEQAGKNEEPPQAASPAPPVPAPPAPAAAAPVEAPPPAQKIVEHVTGKGRTLRGVVRTDLTKAQAETVDAYTFRKDGGFFIREKHLEALDAAFPLVAKPPAASPPVEAPAADPVVTPKATTLVDTFYEAIKADGMPGGNLQLKKMVEAFDGRPATPARMKEAQEALEAAIVMTARDVIARRQSTAATFDALVRLYESQPLLNVRTSTSIENQAYSTPAPLAYLVSKLAGITASSTVHEPTAGNGMLLIGTQPGLAAANEINPDRAASLRAQGFEVTQQDASVAPLLTPGTTDVVVANPPFGPIKGGKLKVDGYTIGQVDHLIAAHALATMRDDGRAVLVLGANKVTGGQSLDDTIFFNWLRKHYRVAAVFEVEGDLYERQGAGWPVRVVVVDGRGPSAEAVQTQQVERVRSWKDVYGQYEQVTQQLAAERRAGVSGSTQPGREAGTGPVPQQPAAAPAAADRPGPAGSPAGAADVAGERAGVVGDRRAVPGKPVGESVGTVRPAEQPSPSSVVGVTGGARAVQPAGGAGGVGLTDADNQFQVKYVPRSGNQDKGVLIPVNMAGPLQDALNRLEDQVGNIDEYVASELGYESVEALHSGFMGLQVDSVAAAIYQIKAGKGIVIADQTGIGKGRQAAAIIRWAARAGHVPVFVTVKPSLFTDMYGDLHDIGTDDVNPFIMNVDASIKGAGDEKLFGNRPSAHRKAIDDIAETGALPEDRNALFMTYSQINVDNAQRKAVSALAPRSVFILDESHNAGGESNTGEFIKSVLAVAQGVTYLSATYAKRPDNMPVYFKTDIGEASGDDVALMNAMASGGLPLQTVVSNNLVKAGQMFRRERSYDGVNIETRADTAHREEHQALADRTTEALRAIMAADRQFHEGYVASLKASLAAQGEGLKDDSGNQAKESADHTEFSSVVHNFVRQMLLGLKAQTAADEAVASLKRGEKPLIAVENTMGSFLSEYAEANSLKPGDPLGVFDYRNVLSRALERSRFIRRRHANGDEERVHIKLEELDPMTRQAYDDAQAIIDRLKLTIPVSPIDWMREQVTKAGYSVMEITGRNLSVDYSDPKNPKLDVIDPLEQKDKVRTTRMFNDGTLDAIILNVAGSTGISLHASERFRDQRQRHMVVAQAAQDINIFMQMLGRVHRTGQVALPKYTILNVDLPAEKRPTALLSKKMKSLNANTSSNTESATSVKAYDMLNKYGDQVIGEYLADNNELTSALGVEVASEGKDQEEDLARKATGRLALMPVSTQERFYEDVEESYGTLIAYLDKTNQNELEPRTFDYDARLLKERTLFQGKNPDSPFGQDASYGEYSVKAQGKAMTPEEVKTLIGEHLAGKSSLEHAVELRKRLDEGFNAFTRTQSGPLVSVANQVRGVAMSFINDHQIGSAWRVEINGEVYNAVVTNLRSTHKTTGNPFALSKLQISIAVNGALRAVTTAATTFRRIEVAALGGNASTQDIGRLFGRQPDNQREEVKIVTGNLLGAFGEIKSVRGTIISFTKEDGSIEQGILLPKKFVYDNDVAQDYRMGSAAEALNFLTNSRAENLRKFGIMSRDNIVRVLPYGDGGITLQVPKSKAKGGRFFLDANLRGLMGDFVSSGNFMRASVEDPAKSLQAMEVILKKQALYAVQSMAEEAKTLGASFDLADEPVPAAEVVEEGADPRDVAAVADLQEKLNRVKAKPVKLTALPPPTQPPPGASRAEAERFAATELVSKVFGKRAVFFSADGGAVNGAALGSQPKVLFVNEATRRPVLAVLGHELLHQMRRDNPGLYDRLADRLDELVRNPGEHFMEFVERYTTSGVAIPDVQKIREELVADIVGDNFTDPAFWRGLQEGRPGLFQRVLGAVRDFLNGVLERLRNDRPFGTDKYLSDVVAARDAVVQAMKEYAASQAAGPSKAAAAAGDLSLSVDRHTPEQRAALARAGIDTRSRLQRAGDKIRESYGRAVDAWKDNWARQFQQGYLDQFTGIAQAIERELGGLPVDQDPYVAARLANGGASSVMRGLLLHGQAAWAANGQHLVKIPDTRGLLDILAPLGDDLNDFFGWMIGNRAARLAKEGRERNLTPAQIQTLQDLAKGKEAKFRAAALEYAAFKRSVLDIAEHAGLIDGEARKVWDNADYIPFYRKIDQEAVFTATGRKGLAGQSSGIRTLRGGEAALNDPLENIIMNFSRLVDASLKNRALAKTVGLLEQAGSDVVKRVGMTFSKELVPASEVKKVLKAAGTPDVVMDILPPAAFAGMAKMWAMQPPADPDIVRVMVGGHPRYYRVNDPLLLKALTSFVPFDFPGLGVLRAFKRILTAGVTAAPPFWIRNFVRDTAAAQLVGRDGFFPGKSVSGIVKSYLETGAGEAMLFAGASFQSGHVNAGDPAGTGAAIRRALRRRGFNAATADGFVGTVIDTPARWWEHYRRVGESVENSNREAVYEAAAKAGKGSTAAAYEAKDLMDFTLRGSSPVYQFMADVLPFFNARVQGLYRLGRANPKRLAAYGLLMMVASLALAWANEDNDEYNELPDWDKDNYWHFWIGGEHFRLPKPFELGVAFATIPERIQRYIRGQDTGKKVASRVVHDIVEQFAFDPVPQAIRPGLNVTTNRDTFRDRPIESVADTKKQPAQRYSALTSPAAVALAQAAEPVANATGLGPKKLEYLVNAYFGTVGAYALGLADLAVAAMDNKPPAPARRLDDLPLVREFYRMDPARATVYEQDLYALRTEVEEIYATVRDKAKKGDTEGAVELAQREATKLALRPQVKSATELLQDLNKKRDAIYADKRMTPQKKREEVDKILAQKALISRKVMTNPAVRSTQ